jgi:hypothetical protein
MLGMARDIRNDDEGVWRNGELHTVMLAGPDRPHPALICHGAEVKKITVQAGMILIWRDPLHMGEKRKVHVVSLV